MSAALVLVGLGHPVRAATAAASQDRESSAPAISILSQSSWVTPSGSFDLALHIDGASPTDLLDLTVFPRITTRAQLDDSVDGESLGRPLDAEIVPFAITAFPTTTTADGTSGIQASIPVSPDVAPPFGVRLSQPGVYPVRISITDEDGVELSSVVTHLLRLPTSDDVAPLAVALIVPIQAPPAVQPDGTTSIDPAALARIDAALDAFAIPSHAAVPLTLAPTPETIDALATVDNQVSEGTAPTKRLTTFASAARTRQILGRPFVDLDLGSWVAAPSPADTELNQQLLTGAEVIAARVGVRPDTRTILADRTTTAEALTRFTFTGTNQLVIPQAQLAPLTGSNPATPFQAFDVQDSNGQPIRSIATNDDLVTRLTETPDPVLNGHLVLADLALTWITTGTGPRGTVLSVPAGLDVPTETYDALLDGLSRTDTSGAGAMVSPVSIDDLFRITGAAPGRGGGTLVRDYDADLPRSLGPLPSRAADTRAEIASYRSMLRADTSRADLLDRQVLVSEASELDDETSDAYLDGVDQFITDQLAGIVAPDRQRVTLTAERGELPITVENALDYEVEVVVSIASVKLEFPEGNSQTVVLPPASSTRVTIPVSSRTTGAFPVEVSVRTPDDQLPIASARFTVRSTAISGIGLVLSISAGAFLLLWWGLHFRKTRRANRLIDSNHPTLR